MNKEQFVVRKRKYHGHGKSIYWIGKMQNGKFVPYSDMLGPTGYGHQDKAMAENILKEIEERKSRLHGE